ncbi:MAG: site-specific integrase, partial [Rhizomicrobium sp.]
MRDPAGMAQVPEELKALWLSALRHERRASPNTLRAYGDDVARFLCFEREHLGGKFGERVLEKLSPADIRAFIARRRSEGLGAGGVQRALAAIRGFYKFLARERILENAAPTAVRAPRVKRGLPRPLSETDAARVLAEAATHNVEWLAARDVALLTLLYGAGLRISEALSLRRGDVPFGDTLTIVGKGRMERMVPVLPVLEQAISSYDVRIPFT